jgi:hypothetical protein
MEGVLTNHSNIETHLLYSSKEYYRLNDWFWDTLRAGDVTKATRIKYAVEGMVALRYHHTQRFKLRRTREDII